MFEVIPVERPAESLSNRLARRAVGWFMTIFGIAMLLLFVRATATEVMDGTFFGLCICLLMLTCSVLLMRDGYALAVDMRVQLRPWE